MDKPLTKWYCDVCGRPIENINDGYVIWKTSGLKSHNFKIIHQSKCDLDDHIGSAALEDFIGEKGFVYLSCMLSIGPIKKLIGQGSHCDVIDMDEFVDFMRRVQTPFYEEARRYFKNPNILEDYFDANEYSPYLPEQLKRIIQDSQTKEI